MIFNEICLYLLGAIAADNTGDVLFVLNVCRARVQLIPEQLTNNRNHSTSRLYISR